jgi:formylglycine-generating enzyme required for sulfatase activity
MVRESFSDHIAEMARWREETLRNAEAEKKILREKVEKLLADHLVSIPAGSFRMGSEKGGADERPVREVAVPAFKLGRTAVTFELYDLCVQSTRCVWTPEDEGWGRGDRPVINLSYDDISRQFLPWLRELTGKPYRLPSEAEWEYAARAGSAAEYAWGDNLSCTQARFDGGVASVCNAREGAGRGTVPVRRFKPNALGLYDMHGNTWEWVEDCWNPSYEGAPVDGSAWTSGNCNVRVLRGGAWDQDKSALRSANRFYFAANTRKPSYGFRLALSE